MPHFYPDFVSLAKPFDIAELDRSKAVIYGIDASYRILYLNEEWFRFAKANNGEPEISIKCG